VGIGGGKVDLILQPSLKLALYFYCSAKWYIRQWQSPNGTQAAVESRNLTLLLLYYFNMKAISNRLKKTIFYHFLTKIKVIYCH
jgi:hypothetical protein